MLFIATEQTWALLQIKKLHDTAVTGASKRPKPKALAYHNWVGGLLGSLIINLYYTT
jgi:hypothetical protein